MTTDCLVCHTESSDELTASSVIIINTAMLAQSPTAKSNLI